MHKVFTKYLLGETPDSPEVEVVEEVREDKAAAEEENTDHSISSGKAMKLVLFMIKQGLDKEEVEGIFAECNNKHSIMNLYDTLYKVYIDPSDINDFKSFCQINNIDGLPDIDFSGDFNPEEFDF